MLQTISRPSWIPAALLLTTLVAISGCGGDDDGESGAAGGRGGSASNSGGSAGTSEPGKTSLFAVPSEIYTEDTSTSYISLVPSLDVPRIPVNGREVDGRGTVAKLGDYFFVASSSAPVIQRFSLREDGSLEAAGSLDFSNYGLPEYFTIDAWGGVLVDAERAYAFNYGDGSHVVWNPSTMEITGTIPGPGVIEEGYIYESIGVVRGDRMYRIFTFLNYDTWEFLSAPQYLAVYDLKKNEQIELVEETRCSQLYSRPFTDERGDIYFSGWVWTPGLTLTGAFPPSCALRIRNGEDSFDPDWQLDFAAEVTDGREAGILRYRGSGKALLDVFHDERVTIDANTDPQELMNTANWRLWDIDLETKTGAPIESLDFTAGGYTDVQVDGRNFLMLPNDDYSETTAFEFVNDELVEGFKVKGMVDHIVKLR